MPSKSRRAASRQAQLQRRRRRGKARTQVFDPGPSESEAIARSPVIDAEESPPPEPVLDTASTRRPARLSRRRAIAEAAPVYSYLGSELKRIGVITSLIAVMLAVLTFLLR